MKTYNVPIVGNCIPIMSFKTITDINTVYMAELSENNENLLDNKSPCIININGLQYVVKPNKVYAYGIIDFNDENDLVVLEDCDIPYSSSIRKVYIYNDYDYKTNTITIPGKYERYLESTNNIEIFKQCHGRINKPERIVIFKASKNDIRESIR